jgi:hypothetical protein
MPHTLIDEKFLQNGRDTRTVPCRRSMTSALLAKSRAHLGRFTIGSFARFFRSTSVFAPKARLQHTAASVQHTPQWLFRPRLSPAIYQQAALILRPTSILLPNCCSSETATGFCFNHVDLEDCKSGLIVCPVPWSHTKPQAARHPVLEKQQTPCSGYTFYSFIMSKNRNLPFSKRIPPLVRPLISDRALKALDVVRTSLVTFILQYHCSQLRQIEKFVTEECIPAETVYVAQMGTTPEQRWNAHPQIMEELKEKAKKLGLWNMFLPKNHFKEGAGFSNTEYGLMAEILGSCSIASEV